MLENYVTWGKNLDFHFSLFVTKFQFTESLGMVHQVFSSH